MIGTDGEKMRETTSGKEKKGKEEKEQVFLYT